MLSVGGRVQLVLLGHKFTLNTLLNLTHQRLKVSLISPDQGNRITLLPPSRVTANLDTTRLNLGRELGQIRRNSTLGQGGAKQEAEGTLPLGVGQSWNQMRLQMLEQTFEETGYAGEDVDVAVYDGDGYPHVFCDEEGLLFGGDVWVEGELDHAQFGG